MSLYAQDLSKHQWKDRLILIIASKNNQKFQQQHKELQKEREGLKERKLVIYQILPEKYKTGFKEKNWKKYAELFEAYNGKKSDFRVLLIGLDGGKKLDQTKMLSVKKLFNIIDSMPMRQAEIQKNKQ